MPTRTFPYYLQYLQMHSKIHAAELYNRIAAPWYLTGKPSNSAILLSGRPQQVLEEYTILPMTHHFKMVDLKLINLSFEQLCIISVPRPTSAIALISERKTFFGQRRVHQAFLPTVQPHAQRSRHCCRPRRPGFSSAVFPEGRLPLSTFAFVFNQLFVQMESIRSTKGRVRLGDFILDQPRFRGPCTTQPSEGLR
jgi:hypothetical protein